MSGQGTQEFGDPALPERLPIISNKYVICACFYTNPDLADVPESPPTILLDRGEPAVARFSRNAPDGTSIAGIAQSSPDDQEPSTVGDFDDTLMSHRFYRTVSLRRGGGIGLVNRGEFRRVRAILLSLPHEQYRGEDGGVE